jgi:hypothetical protein
VQGRKKEVPWIAEGLGDTPRSGRPDTKAALLDQTVPGLLESDPQAHGYPANGWTNRLLCAEVKRQHHVQVLHQTILGRLLVSGWAGPYSLERAPAPDDAALSGVLCQSYERMSQSTLDDQMAICYLEPGHQGDGAIFNRFGLLTVMKHADEGGEVWLDDVTVNGQREHFNRDPGWDSRRNRRTYTTSDVRPRFDFGFSPTHFAQGKAPGELGGLVFRGDGRYPDKIACYGDHLSLLTLSRPLKARGKVCLRRAVSDSTTLIGFFHSSDSTRVEDSQSSALPENFLGVAVEGPSREGFFFYPAYRLKGGGEDTSRGPDPPRIYPDGSAHDWSLEYTPPSAGERGQVVVTLDGESSALALDADPTSAQVRFDRFGIITTRIDGNGQTIYFDDLSYTFRQGG